MARTNVGYGTGYITTADEYKGQEAMMPDLGEAWKEGEKYYYDQLKREQGRKLDEINLMTRQMDLETKIEARAEADREDNEMDNEAQGLAAIDGSADLVQTVKDISAGITGAGNLPDGWSSWSDQKKKAWINSRKTVISQIQGMGAQADNILNSDPPIDLTVPENKRIYDIAKAMKAGAVKKGNSRMVTSKDGNTVEVFDLIVTLKNGEEVTVEGGDFSKILSGTRDGASISFVNGKLGTTQFMKNLNTPGEFVDEIQLDAMKPEFLKIFSGEDPASLKSFAHYVGDKHPDVEIEETDEIPGISNAEEAWAAYRQIQLELHGDRFGTTSQELSTRKTRQGYISSDDDDDDDDDNSGGFSYVGSDSADTVTTAISSVFPTEVGGAWNWSSLESLDGVSSVKVNEYQDDTWDVTISHTKHGKVPAGKVTITSDDIEGGIEKLARKLRLSPEQTQQLLDKIPKVSDDSEEPGFFTRAGNFISSLISPGRAPKINTSDDPDGLYD